MANWRLVETPLLTEPSTRRALVDRLVRDPPVVIAGPAPSLYMLAAAVLEDGRTPAFEACFSHGSTLHDHYRTLIEQAFGCPVWERFGSAETGVIVHPCQEASSWHIPATVIFVELVRDDGTPAGPGEMGHVLVTTLRNPAMPLIRYRTGDLAVRRDERCTCGRTLPMLERVIGRAPDLLVTASGGLIPPEDVVRSAIASAPHAILDLDVTQRADLTVGVRVMPRDGVPFADVARGVANVLDELVGVPGATRVEQVDVLPLPPSGKRRHVVSEARAAALRSSRSTI
jgi:phenylacetate-CoA ligase